MSSIDLRFGEWEHVLADVECDAQIGDPPYGERVHKGATPDGLVEAGLLIERIEYDWWTPDHVHAFVRSWSPRTKGWMCNMTSHDLIPAWEAAYEEVARYYFAPVPCICANPGARKTGDGPASGAVYLMVARPKREEFIRYPNAGGSVWGSLPHKYDYVRHVGEGGGGRGKPIVLLEAIIRDYTKPGDIVCDPVFGWASTARAARSMKRRFVGAERDREAYERAVRECGLGYQPVLL